MSTITINYNNYYAFIVEFSAATYSNGNFSHINLHRLKVKSRTAYHTFYTRGTASAGFRVGSVSKSASSISIDVPAGGESGWIDIADTGNVRVNHDSNGNGSVKIGAYFNSGVGDMGYGVPTGGWKEATYTFSKTDVAAPTVTATYASKSYKSLTFNVKTNVACDKVQYRLNSGSWVDVSGGTTANVNKSVSISGLYPNTSYSVQFRCKKTSNQVWGSSTAQSQTTNKPPKPTVGTVSVSDITHSTATGKLSGFKMGDMATLDTYRYSVRYKGGSEVAIPLTEIGKNTTVKITGLAPNTGYSFWADAVDNYGQVSPIAKIDFTTLEDQAKAFIKIDGTWKKGKVFYKKNGRWTKVKKIFKKVNGEWVCEV